MILVLVEHDGDRPSAGGREALTFAREAAASLSLPIGVVLLGNGARDAARAIDDDSVEACWAVENGALEPYAPAAWARCVAGVVALASARLVVAVATTRGQEILAGAAAALDAPLAAGCVAIGWGPDGRATAESGERLAVTRLRWGGSVMEEALLDGSPAFVSIPEHTVIPEAEVERPAEARPPETPSVTALGVGPDELRVRLVRHEPAAPGSVALADARVVVGGGRGVGGPEGFAQLEELAALLGGAVGVSRVVTSAGWRPHAEQVGQTGTRIAPELYIACGISGAIQHIVGCRGARAILAINTDREAPIMSRATHAVIGDLHAVVPAITAEVRRTLGGHPSGHDDPTPA